jgi:hypothetical protein
MHYIRVKYIMVGGRYIGGNARFPMLTDGLSRPINCGSS